MYLFVWYKTEKAETWILKTVPIETAHLKWRNLFFYNFQLENNYQSGYTGRTNDDGLPKNLEYLWVLARNIPATKQLLMQPANLPFLFLIPHKAPVIGSLWLTVTKGKWTIFNKWWKEVSDINSDSMVNIERLKLNDK